MSATLEPSYFLLWHSKTMAIWHRISTDNLIVLCLSSSFVFCGNTVTQHSYNAWPNQTVSSLEFCFQELFWSGKHKDKELTQWLFNHSTVWPHQSPVSLIRKGDKNKPFDGTGWQSGQWLFTINKHKKHYINNTSFTHCK